MGIPDIIEEALHLKPQERYIIIESLVQSLNKPDEEIEKIWIEESKKRLQAYRDGTIKTLSYDQVFEK